MNLSHGHFYTTIKEADETAIKQYSKVHYFICLIRPWRLKKMYSSEIAPTNKKN